MSICFLILVLLSCFVDSFFGQNVKVDDRKELSQYGITWTFDKPTKSGQFITGDWWIIGPVTVTKITPAPGKGSSEGVKIEKGIYGDTSLTVNSDMRNGSMVVNRCGDNQGYDSRSVTYDASLSLKLPYNLEADRSLISSISNTSFPVESFSKNISVSEKEKKSQSALKAAAVLTCLSEEPPPDAFRPAYVGKEKVIYEEKDINWDLLPKLSPAGSVPSWPEYERYFQRPWIDHICNWGYDEIVPNENMPNYGREHSRMVSTSSLMLCVNESKEKKRKLLIGLVQYGLDISGAAKNGGVWNMGGGISMGRKWPVLFASIMLADPKIAEFPASAVFHEDVQTYYGKGWFGQTALYQMVMHHGPRPTYENKRPEQLTNQWDKLSDAYRMTNSVAWVGTALAARYMKAIKLWGHDAYFDYIDRWMRPDDPYKSARGSHPRPALETTTYDPFVTSMWQTHRNNAPEQEMSGKNMFWDPLKSCWVANSKP